MTRIQLTDGSGRWFDREKAQVWKEGTYFDGSNHVSLCAGKHNHQSLYRTAGGRWILLRWSQWQGSATTWEEITAEEAARWLSINEHEPHPSLEEAFAALEIK